MRAFFSSERDWGLRFPRLGDVGEARLLEAWRHVLAALAPMRAYSNPCSIAVAPQEVDAVIAELAAAVTGAAGVNFAPRLADRLRAYARSVAHFPTALKVSADEEWGEAPERRAYSTGCLRAHMPRCMRRRL